MIIQKKVPLKFTLLFLFHCPLYNNLNVLGAPKYNKDNSYLPTWEDLDTRPLPLWYDSAKIGILVNWGLHSVLSSEDESLLSSSNIGKYTFNVIVQ